MDNRVKKAHHLPVVESGENKGATSRENASENPYQEVHRKVERAKRAAGMWAELPLGERIAHLKKGCKKLLQQRVEIIDLVWEEIGKIPSEAMFTEALGPLDAISAWSSIAKKEASYSVGLNPLAFPGKSAEVVLEARGVVGIIAPWNFPVAGLYRSVIPALLFGNAVVLKPSEYSPRSSAWFADILASELPFDVLQVVQGDGKVGAELLESNIDACVFTGSTKTGKLVERACFEKDIVCSAEMGGKDAALVLPDCDLKRSVAGVTQWSLQNAGQACGAIEIVYVLNEIADEFVAELTRAFSDLDVSSGDRGDYDVSAIANDRQLSIVEDHIADAKSKGATVVAGGKRASEGRFFLPTLIDHCSSDMRVVSEETFGPVLAIVRVSGVEGAIRAINESDYGLTASIWSKDHARAKRLASRIDVGVVTINNHAFTGAIPTLPWSGRRQSGSGIANSRYSLDTFTKTKVIALDKNKGPDLFWLPLGKDLFDIGHLLSDAQLGKNLLSAARLPLAIRGRVQKIKAYFRM